MPRVLKSPPPADTALLSPFAFDDLGRHAKSQLEDARRQADEIIADAHREAERLKRQAEAAGRAAAVDAAEQDAAQRVARQLDALLPAVREAVDGLQQAKAGWLAHWEQAALHLATAIAERVIRREVARAPEITLSLVAEALELSAGSAELQLRMHPDDVDALGPRVERLIAEVGRLGAASLVADSAITPGGCRVETRHGTIDQQFEAQLSRIAQELS